MISNNETGNNASGNAIIECGSVKRKLRSKTSGSNQDLQDLVIEEVHSPVPSHGRRRVSNGGESGLNSSVGNKKVQSTNYNRRQTRGTTQQQLLLAQQLPQVSITLIKNPNAVVDDDETESQDQAKRPEAQPHVPKVNRAMQSAGNMALMQAGTNLKRNVGTSGSPAPKKSPVQGAQSHSASSQRNFMNNLPYMGELTFDSRPRRGRKPKKADICHLISKNYGIEIPKYLPSNPCSKSMIPIASSPPSLPLPFPKRKKQPPSIHAPNFTLNSMQPEGFMPVRANNLYSSRSSSSPSLITLQKLYHEKFSQFGLPNPKDILESSVSAMETQPLNLCKRDAEAEMEDGEDEEDEEQEYNNNIRSWLNTVGVNDECYDSVKNKRRKTIIANDDEEKNEDDNQDDGGNEDDGYEEPAMQLSNDGVDYDTYGSEDVKRRVLDEPSKFSSFLVKNHFLCNENDDELDVGGGGGGENGNDGEFDSLPEISRKRKRFRQSNISQTIRGKSSSIINPSDPNLRGAGAAKEWTYHHHHLVPAKSEKSKPKGRESRSHRRNRPSKQGNHPKSSNAANAAVSAAVAASNNAQVSICKFKFTGGVKPTLQEKKMLSLDSGGNFRFYTDKPLQSPAAANSGNDLFPGSSVYPHTGPVGSSSNKCKGSSSSHKNLQFGKGKNDCKTTTCGNVTTSTSLLSLPKSAKSMSMCMLPTGFSSSVPVPDVSTSSSPIKSIISPLVLPDITISACTTANSTDNSPGDEPDCFNGSLKSSCCNSSSCCSSRASSPCRSYCSNSSEPEDVDSQNNSLLQVPSPLQQPSSSSLSASATRRPTSLNSGNSSPYGQSRGSFQPNNSDNSRRRTKKSVARENLEKTFKEKGFLIQTQQLESSEGVTYCKFRQLKKFTRYLFRSWKDYLPENVKDSIVISGSGNQPGRQDSQANDELDDPEENDDETRETENENDDNQEEEDEIAV